MKDYLATIVENKKIANGVYSITFRVDEDVQVRCGQFGEIAVGGSHLLRRPIAICKVEGRDITFCYQVKGEGTQRLKSTSVGEKLNVLMPLGNGFFVEEGEQKVALVGGGVGIFPLVSVLREYLGKKQISSYMGFRNKAAVCMLEELEKADMGFERVYERVKDAFQENRYLYEAEIKEMQQLIKKITDYTAKIQAQELRNKQLMEYYFQRKKNEVKAFQFNQHSANKYTSHLADRESGVSYFFDNRK